MAMKFQDVQAEDLHLRMALIGPSGSGKTWTGLTIAEYLCGGPEVYKAEDIAFLDSERRSALKYKRKQNRPRSPGAWDFRYIALDSFHPQKYIDGIKAAEESGFKVLIIDSLSHAWIGKDGELDLVDRQAKRSNSHNSFNAWREVTPLHNALVDAIMGANLHVILTLRVKTEYVVEKDERTGKQVPRKVGLAPVMRDGIEYEADVVAELDQKNNLEITKSRCPGLQGYCVHNAGKELAQRLSAWLDTGATPAAPPARQEPKPATQPAPQPVPTAQQPAAPTNGNTAASKEPPRTVAELAKRIEAAEKRYVPDLFAAGELARLAKSFADEEGYPEDRKVWSEAQVRAVHAELNKSVQERQSKRMSETAK